MTTNIKEYIQWHVIRLVVHRVLVALLLALVGAGLIPADLLQAAVDIVREVQEAAPKPLSLLYSKPLPTADLVPAFPELSALPPSVQ